MAELTKEQLIELITKEVLRTLGGGEPEEPPDKSGLPLALVIGPAEQLAVYLRLALPAIYDQTAHETGVTCGNKSLSIDDFTTGTVDDYGRTAQLSKKFRVGYMVGPVLPFTGQRRMESDYVSLTYDGFEIRPPLAALGLLPRRIADKHPHIKPSRPTLHDRPNMTSTHNTERIRLQRTVDNLHQSGKNILRNRRSIATRSIHRSDRTRPAIVKVDMVGTDGGSGDHLDRRLGKQLSIAPRPRTDNHTVGITHRLGGYLLRREVTDIGIRVKKTGNIRDIALYDKSYITVWHI